MDESGPLRAKLGRLRQKARYYDRVRLVFHLEAALAAIDELEERLAELERASGDPASSPAPAPALDRPTDTPPADPAAACGFT
ncbi:MAG: hypothetical protein C0501_04915 [Isosphaera sp.]|nr:hypothetical protein [Isosphaera sp.]